MKYLKIVAYFFKFIKEVILGKATIAEAYQFDPRRFWVLIIILVSLVLNVITIPALVRSAQQGMELKLEIEKLRLKQNDDKETKYKPPPG